MAKRSRKSAAAAAETYDDDAFKAECEARIDALVDYQEPWYKKAGVPFNRENAKSALMAQSKNLFFPDLPADE